MKHELHHKVEWGECDPAGIVFYPNIYRWFDLSTQDMMEANGFGQAKMITELNIVGFPLIETHAEYKHPMRWGEIVTVASKVDAWSKKTFTVRHKLAVSGRDCVLGYEVRFWAKTGENENKAIQIMELPGDFLNYLVKTTN